MLFSAYQCPLQSGNIQAVKGHYHLLSALPPLCETWTSAPLHAAERGESRK